MVGSTHPTICRLGRSLALPQTAVSIAILARRHVAVCHGLGCDVAMPIQTPLDMLTQA